MLSHSMKTDANTLYPAGGINRLRLREPLFQATDRKRFAVPIEAEKRAGAILDDLDAEIPRGRVRGEPPCEAAEQRHDLEPVAATQAKVKFGNILHQTSVNGKKFVVNRQGKPVSVILSYNDYCQLLEQASRSICEK